MRATTLTNTEVARFQGVTSTRGSKSIQTVSISPYLSAKLSSTDKGHDQWWILVSSNLLVECHTLYLFWFMNYKVKGAKVIYDLTERCFWCEGVFRTMSATKQTSVIKSRKSNKFLHCLQMHWHTVDLTSYGMDKVQGKFSLWTRKPKHLRI